MLSIRKLIQFSIIVITMVCLFIPFLASTSYAAEEVKLEADSIQFDKNSKDYNEWIFSTDDSVAIKDAVSADEKVATVKYGHGWIVVYPVNEGATTILVTGVNDTTATVQVTVDKSYFIQALKSRIHLENYWYGTKKISVGAPSGSKGNVKIGKTTYKFTVGKSGWAKIKLKKVYKLNTKIKVTATHNGYTSTAYFRFFSGVSYDFVKASKHIVKMTTVNLHKGDTVKVIYKRGRINLR